jgi:hypothetical protein
MTPSGVRWVITTMRLMFAPRGLVFTLYTNANRSDRHVARISWRSRLRKPMWSASGCARVTENVREGLGGARTRRDWIA